MSNVVILGAQWGDEGKGKIVDLFSDRFDIVARYQGGHNAGHTVFIGEKKFVLKLIPSGILRPGKQAVIGNGLVIDPAALLSEIETLEAAGVAVSRQLSISNRAHVLFPAHRMMEKMSEGRPGQRLHRHHLARHRPLLRGQNRPPRHPHGRPAGSRDLPRAVRLPGGRKSASSPGPSALTSELDFDAHPRASTRRFAERIAPDGLRYRAAPQRRHPRRQDA